MKKVYVVYDGDCPIDVYTEKKTASEEANILANKNAYNSYSVETFISLDEFKTWKIDD